LRRDWKTPIEVDPIGYVKVDLTDDEVRRAWAEGGVEGYVEVKKEYSAGLEGIDGFSHLLIIAWFHRAVPWHRKVLKVKPRRLLMYGFTLDELPLIGVFASDSPDRPNPIGVDVVELVGREGRRLRVKGLDFFDGTPVLDIKAFTEEYIPKEPIKYPEWYNKLAEMSLKKLGRRISI
jgi:tRNA-Thr(GGU) m(6)t(6)A37 methyltransferase TsaA